MLTTPSRIIGERLGEEAEGESAGFQLPFQFRAASARLDEGYLGSGVNLYHPVHARHIHRDDGRELEQFDENPGGSHDFFSSFFQIGAGGDFFF